MVMAGKCRMEDSSVMVPLSEITQKAFCCSLTYSMNPNGFINSIIGLELAKPMLSSFLRVRGWVETITFLQYFFAMASKEASRPEKFFSESTFSSRWVLTMKYSPFFNPSLSSTSFRSISSLWYSSTSVMGEPVLITVSGRTPSASR